MTETKIYPQMPSIQVRTWIASTGVGKSRMFRSTGVKFLNRTKFEGVAVIAVDRHDLGQEQLNSFYQEHAGTALVARIWRGRGAKDIEVTVTAKEIKQYEIAVSEDGTPLMCWRNNVAEEVSEYGLSVETSLCKQHNKETGEDIYCPFYKRCGFQRQKVPANLWFCAHECLTGEVPTIFGKVLPIYIDEDPLDAFFYGIEDKYEVPLDALTAEPRNIEDQEKRAALIEGNKKLHDALVNLPEGPVPANALELDTDLCNEMFRTVWEDKAKASIRPDMSDREVRTELATAAHNKTVIKLARLWDLIARTTQKSWKTIKDGKVVIHKGAAPDTAYSGWIELARDSYKVRVIRMKGLNEPAAGWQRPTTIASATLDPVLLREVWAGDQYRSKHEKYEFTEWDTKIVRRPRHVVVRQVVDSSFSKTWMLPTDEKERIERGREIYAMVLREASKFAPQRSLLIVHQGTETIIRKYFHLPDWIELAHHGAITGLNRWETVRAAFIVGRAMPPAELITRQAEAITGEYIAQRNYVERKVAIRVEPLADKCNALYVSSWEHPHPIGQRLLRRVVWGGVLQEAGRTRYILRGADSPLDIWLVNDVSVPELGAVIPVQWSDTDAMLGPKVCSTLDDLMMATGCWLENAADAKRVHDAIIASPTALRMERSRTKSAAPYQKLIEGGSVDGGFQVVSYRTDKPKTQKTRAILLAGLSHAPKEYLEERLGVNLTEFEVL